MYQIDALVEHFRACAPVCYFAHAIEAGRDRTQADREYGPPIRELIERRSLARDLPWSAPRNRREQRAQADAVGAGCDRREQTPRVHAIRGFPDKDAIPAGLLREDRLLQLLGRG